MADFTPINTQEELDRIIGERLRRERETVTKSFEQKIAEKETESGKLKADMEAVNKRLEEANQKISGIPDLEKKIKAYEVASVKSKVARETGIPFELAERLSGETEEDIRKDAEGLRKVIGSQQPSAPRAGGERSGGGKNDENASWLQVAKSLKGE